MQTNFTRLLNIKYVFLKARVVLIFKFAFYRKRCERLYVGLLGDSKKPIWQPSTRIGPSNVEAFKSFKWGLNIYSQNSQRTYFLLPREMEISVTSCIKTNSEFFNISRGLDECQISFGLVVITLLARLAIFYISREKWLYYRR